MTCLADILGLLVLPSFFGRFPTLSDILVIWQTRCATEDTTGVGTVERARFGGRVEYLRVSQRVLFKVVNGFVRFHGLLCALVDPVHWKHRVDGLGVGDGKVLLLFQSTSVSQSESIKSMQESRKGGPLFQRVVICFV